MMSAELPIVRKTAWAYIVPQLILLFLLTLFFWKTFLPTSFSMAAAYAAVVYLLYSFGSKSLLLRYHREGIHLSKRQAFREAIDRFQRSYGFLEKHPWLDKYRFITMLDSSALSYREMALLNIAYSHVQLDEKATALKYYQRALQEFPESEMAQSGIEYVASK
jgi:tetratricopeptide (TPR) repeat protein